jgi:molecular chaperone DnaK (HSP70)
MKNDVAKGIKELLSSKSAIDFSSLPIEIGAHYSELENTLVTKSRPTPLCDRIERIDFEKACKGQFDQIIEKIKKFLNRVLECDLVVLVGGSFLIPYVQNRLREELEKREIRVEVDKDHFWLRHFVVTGAAIYARKPTAYPEVRDRFTYEVGLRKWDGSFDKIIARNTPRQDFEIQCNLTADHNVADAEGEARFELWEYAGTDPVRGEGIYRVKEFPLAELSMDHREALYRGGLSATLKYDARRDIIDLKIGEEILMGEDSVIRERVVPDYLARDAQERLNRLLGSGVLPLGDEEHLEELRLLLELPKIRLVDYIRVCDALNAIEVTISRRSDQLNEHDL